MNQQYIKCDKSGNVLLDEGEYNGHGWEKTMPLLFKEQR